MSTIRPLATIAVLAVVGAFLAWNINQGPSVALDGQWDASEESQAAAWSPEDGSGDESPEASSITTRSAPAWDAPPPEEAPAAPPAPSLSLPPIGPPAESPEPTISGRVPSLGSSTADLAQQPTAIEPDPPAPALPDPTPSVAAAPVASLPPTPGSGFEAAWPVIQSALQRDELPRAHRMLSQWLLDPSLPAQRRAEVEELLSQLAGTNVYSMEHRLEPPHVVAPGETLATIASEYEVPWQLLAKINGVSASDEVQPGQTLKVVRGPFDARVDLVRGQMTLLLDGRYAGKFPVRVTGQAPPDGLWEVDQKQLDPGGSSTGKIILTGAAGKAVELSSTPTPLLRTQLAVASRDLGDLYDILSVGSSVTILR